MSDEGTTEKTGTSGTSESQTEDHESKFRGVLKEKSRLENELAKLKAAHEESAKAAAEETARANGELDKVLSDTKAELAAEKRRAVMLEKKHTLATAGFSGVIASGLLAEHEADAAAEPFGDWLTARKAAPDLVSLLAGRPAQPPMVGGVAAAQSPPKTAGELYEKMLEAARKGDGPTANKLKVEWAKAAAEQAG
jgi:hypothetical protein